MWSCEHNNVSPRVVRLAVHDREQFGRGLFLETGPDPIEFILELVHGFFYAAASAEYLG